jgi:hypothetical protein
MQMALKSHAFLFTELSDKVRIDAKHCHPKHSNGEDRALQAAFISLHRTEDDHHDHGDVAHDLGVFDLIPTEGQGIRQVLKPVEGVEDLLIRRVTGNRCRVDQFSSVARHLGQVK